MDTLTLDTPGTFRFSQTDYPTELPPGHALVRVHRVGICGTDWHAFHGRQPFFSYPRILGHELGVEVLKTADNTPLVNAGDRCSVEPYLNCGNCIACRRGKTNCCASLQCLGVHTDGGMREQIVVPTRKLHRSAKLSYDQLALVETLAIGCHAVARAQVVAGEYCLILGAGPIGLSVVPFVQAAGGIPIIADVSRPRLQNAQKLFAIRHALMSDASLPESLKAATDGDMPVAVFDATGNAASMARTFELVAHGGRITFVGLFQGDVTFNDPNFHRREITLLATRNALAGDFTRIITLVEEGTVTTTPWITHRCAASEFPACLDTWQKPDGGLLKAVIEF